MTYDKFSDIPKWVFDSIEEKMHDVSYHDYGFVDGVENSKEKTFVFEYVETDDCGYSKAKRLRVIIRYVDFFGSSSILTIRCSNVKEVDEQEAMKKALQKSADEAFEKVLVDKMKERCEEFVINPVTFEKQKIQRKGSWSSLAGSGIPSIISDDDFFASLSPNFTNTIGV